MLAHLDMTRFVALLCGLFLVADASAAPITFNCGVSLSSTVKTESVASSTQSTTFVPVAGATTAVTIPAGSPSRCIKVRFSVLAKCDLVGITNGVDGCFFRATRNGGELNSKTGTSSFAAGAFPVFAAAYSFEWIANVGPGTHTIAIQQRVHDTNTILTILNWTLDVELTD
jgi:hypothetical protein